MISIKWRTLDTFHVWVQHPYYRKHNWIWLHRVIWIKIKYYHPRNWTNSQLRCCPMFVIEINLWFKFNGETFTSTYSITACSFFTIRWTRWNTTNGAVPWCLLPYICFVSRSLVLAVPLHWNGVTSSPIYCRWSDRQGFYYSQNRTHSQ